jgi:hypothetical protein
VYFGMEHFAPWQFGLLLGSLWLARALTARASRQPVDGLARSCSACCWRCSTAHLLRWYPVLISGSCWRCSA